MNKCQHRRVVFAMGGDVKASIETYKSVLRDEVAYLKASGIKQDDINIINYTHRTTVSVDGQIIVEYVFDYNAKGPLIMNNDETIRDIGGQI